MNLLSASAGLEPLLRIMLLAPGSGKRSCEIGKALQRMDRSEFIDIGHHGANSSGPRLEALIAQQQEDEGLEVTYKRITPKWAAYSGFKDGLIRYVKAITVCDDRVAFFLIDYDREAKRDYDPVVTQMEKSLKREGC